MSENRKIFISHAHDDDALCQPLLDRLDALGADYWFDRRRMDAGQALSQPIQQAIAERDIFMRICTPAAQQSYGVMLETSAFRGLQAEDRRRGNTNRVLINLILDQRYQREPFDHAAIFIDASGQSEADWQAELRRALIGYRALPMLETQQTPEPSEPRELPPSPVSSFSHGGSTGPAIGGDMRSTANGRTSRSSTHLLRTLMLCLALAVLVGIGVDLLAVLAGGGLDLAVHGLGHSATATASISSCAGTQSNAAPTPSIVTPAPSPPALPAAAQTIDAGQGLQYVDIMPGCGRAVQNGDNVVVNYTGWLQSSGAEFDSSLSGGRTPFEVDNVGQAQVITGWNMGLVGMKVGGTRRLIIPPALAYGSAGAPPVVPPNATLIFDVTLLGFK